jgi:Tfp pilus assembly protein PilN
MSEKTFGLSIDGDRVTVVETLGDIAVSANSIVTGSLEDSLTVALEGIKQKRKDAPIRVSLLAPSVSLRRMDVTAQLAASRADFEDAVFAALPVNREVTAVAGAFFDIEAMVGDAVTAGVAVVGPAERIEEVYRLAGKNRIELIASPLALTGFDGVWLGLHHGLADVTLVTNGRPLAYRQLRAGGLNALLAVLGDPDDLSVGPSRVLAALTATATDTIADIEVSRYMRMVAAELAQTIEYWRKTGEEVPGNSEVLVYGAGGSHLAENALAEAGFTIVMPDILRQALSYVPPANRAESMLALCSAATAGRHMPQASFTNPLFAALLDTRRKTRKRMLFAAGGLVALLFVGLTIVRPFIDGWLSSRRATDELQAVRVEFADKAESYYKKVDFDARVAVLEEARATQPYWEDVYNVILSSVPQGSAISQIVSTTSGDVVIATVSLSRVNGSYDDLVAWLVRLDATEGVDRVWSSGFSVREDGTASFEVSMQLRVAPGTTPVADVGSSTPSSAGSTGLAPLPVTTVPSDAVPGDSSTPTLPGAPTTVVPDTDTEVRS